MVMMNRRERFKNIRKVVVKVGTSVLTSGDDLDIGYIQRLAGEIAELRRRGTDIILVSSGAISAGMGQLSLKTRPRSIPQLQAAAAVGQNRLMHNYQVAFEQHGLTIAQILLTADDLKDRQRYLNARNTLLTLWGYGIIPIVNENDSVATEEIRVGDNDSLSAQVANLIDADLLIILSDIDGLLSGDPRKCPDASLISTVSEITLQIERFAGKAGREYAIGGMKTKIQAAKIVTSSGEMMVIANGRKDSLIDILEGKQIGTLFLPQGDRMSCRKRWIAFTLEKKGSLIADEGAINAIVGRGKSLLPSGIVDVQGKFKTGEAVGIEDRSGKEIARGLVNYSSDEVKMILGKKSYQIEDILGYCYYEEVIHRDNLVVL